MGASALPDRVGILTPPSTGTSVHTVSDRQGMCVPLFDV